MLVTGHPFVDVWAGIRPQLVNLTEWPDVPRGVEWKQGVCDALGVSLTDFWPHLRNRVRTFADLRPELVGAVERLIDFVAPAGGDDAEWANGSVGGRRRRCRCGPAVADVFDAHGDQRHRDDGDDRQLDVVLDHLDLAEEVAEHGQAARPQHRTDTL